MKFDQLIEKCQDIQCFCPGMLGAGENISHVRVQLNRWVQTGKIIRIHKGWYTLAVPWRRITINPFVIACTIKPGSYVSLQSALSYHGMIPENVPETTCITTGRPQVLETPIGRISYRHVKREAFRDFVPEPCDGQMSYIAVAEKALLDLIYLTPGGTNKKYIAALRLQNLHELNVDRLTEMAAYFHQASLLSIPDSIRDLEAENRMV